MCLSVCLMSNHMSPTTSGFFNVLIFLMKAIGEFRFAKGIAGLKVKHMVRNWPPEPSRTVASKPPGSKTQEYVLILKQKIYIKLEYVPSNSENKPKNQSAQTLSKISHPENKPMGLFSDFQFFFAKSKFHMNIRYYTITYNCIY